MLLDIPKPEIVGQRRVVAIPWEPVRPRRLKPEERKARQKQNKLRWRTLNRARHLKQRAQYRERNREALRLKAAAYRAARGPVRLSEKQKARKRETDRAWALANKEKLQQLKRAWYLKNKERHRLAVAAYAARNPEKINARRAAKRHQAAKP